MRHGPKSCAAALAAFGCLPGSAEGRSTVTGGLPGEPRAQRSQLGAELRRIRMLAVTSQQRSALLPDLPTLKEAGVDVEANAWIGLIAPVKTPK